MATPLLDESQAACAEAVLLRRLGTAARAGCDEAASHHADIGAAIALITALARQAERTALDAAKQSDAVASDDRLNTISGEIAALVGRIAHLGELVGALTPRVSGALTQTGDILVEIEQRLDAFQPAMARGLAEALALSSTRRAASEEMNLPAAPDPRLCRRYPTGASGAVVIPIGGARRPA